MIASNAEPAGRLHPAGCLLGLRADQTRGEQRMRTLPVVVVLGLLLPCTATAQSFAGSTATPSSPRIDRVVISGNHRVEEEAIRVQIRSQPGHCASMRRRSTATSAPSTAWDSSRTSQADLDEENGQWVLTYDVTERPLIREVHIEGNSKLSREDGRAGHLLGQHAPR